MGCWNGNNPEKLCTKVMQEEYDVLIIGYHGEGTMRVAIRK
jgi:hypothetical protein